MKLEVPGKTYLFGEYSVLLGGAAIGLATQPCFQINFQTSTQTKTQTSPAESGTHQFHPESPAARYLAKHGKSVSVSLHDPYLLGGFGRSTAEYWAAIIPDLLTNPRDFHSLLTEYKSLHQGSGIDLAFQYFGSICLADPKLGFFQTFSWHFENLDFFVISTGKKIATHEHLKTLDLDSLKELPVLSEKMTHVFAANKEFEFLSLLKQWCALLGKHNLIHPDSLEMKAKLESFESIKLAKPCGALGADVILIFFAKSQKESVKNFLYQNDYLIQAHSSDLAPGVSAQLEILKAEFQKGAV